MTRAPLPPGHVGIGALIGVRRVTYAAAVINKGRGVYPQRPRPAQPGLVPFDAAGLWAAIERGSFPPPVAGPWGTAWRLNDVWYWRRHNIEPKHK